MNNKDRYIYLPHPTPGFERKVIKPNSERIVDACAELNRLHRSIAKLKAENDKQLTRLINAGLADND